MTHLRHINRVRNIHEKTRRPDSPSELDMQEFGRAIVGRYVDFDARFVHSIVVPSKDGNPDNDKVETVHSYGEYINFLYFKNPHARRSGYEITAGPIFIEYLDITDAVNDKATQHTHSPRRVRSDRSDIIDRVREGIQLASHNHQTLNDKLNSAKKDVLQKLAQTRQEQKIDLSEVELEEQMARIQESIALTSLYWGDSFSLPVKTQPKMRESAHPNGNRRFEYPSVRTRELFEHQTALAGVFRHSGLSVADSDTVTRPGVPVVRLGRELSAIPEHYRPVLFEPPSAIPVKAIELKVFDN